MAIDNQNIQDPTTKGVGGLRGLEGINRLRDRGINIDTSILTLAKDYKGAMAEINQSASPRQDIGFVGVGDSMFDEGITSATQFDNLAVGNRNLLRYSDSRLFGISKMFIFW